MVGILEKNKKNLFTGMPLIDDNYSDATNVKTKYPNAIILYFIHLFAYICVDRDFDFKTRSSY